MFNVGLIEQPLHLRYALMAIINASYLTGTPAELSLAVILLSLRTL